MAGMKGYRSFMGFLEQMARNGVYQLLGVAISTTAICLGLTMIFNPVVFSETFVFHLVFVFASPPAWGTAYIITALAVLIGIFTNPKSAQLPAFMMALIFAAQGLFTIPQIHEGAVPFSLIACIALAWFCLITQLVCGVAWKDHPGEKAVIHH